MNAESDPDRFDDGERNHTFVVCPNCDSPDAELFYEDGFVSCPDCGQRFELSYFVRL